MLGHGHAGEGPAEDLLMRRDEARAVVDVDPILRFADLELPPDQQIGHRVAVAVHIDVALDIDEAMMERVHLRDEERQRPQVRPARRRTAPAGSRGDGASGWRSPCRRRRAPGH